MPKILRIINRFNLGGPSYNVAYLSKYLPLEYETLLIGGPEEEGEISSLFIPLSLDLKPMVIQEMKRSINPFGDFMAYRKIKKIIKEFKPDIVHTHASKAGAIGRLAAIHAKVPIIVHTFHGHVFHGYFSKSKTNIIKSLEKYFAKKSSAIVAISKIQKNELVEIHKICSAEKTVVIPLGFDLNSFNENAIEKRKIYRERFLIDEKNTAIGIIFRFAPIKNHFLFIYAIEFVIKNCPNKKIQGILIGDGLLKHDLQNYIREKGLTYEGANPDFIFAGWEKEVHKALPGLDLVCLTSDNEGTPVSLIEAQAAGKFIVSTNVGGIEDILHPQCGLLSPKGDKNLYCQNLLKAVLNLEVFQENAKIAQNNIVEKFGYQRLCNDMDLLYKKLLAEIKK
jgi:glycosyltransferase involved in cell wall biosynthesis